jgi:hypothetical protein
MGPLTKLVSWLLFPQELTFGPSFLWRSGGQCEQNGEVHLRLIRRVGAGCSCANYRSSRRDATA